jgi:hypothetical protein
MKKRRQLRDHPFFVKLREKCDAQKAKYKAIFKVHFDRFEDKVFLGVERLYDTIGYYKLKYLPKPIYRLQKKSRRYFRTFMLKDMKTADYLLAYMDMGFISFMYFIEYFEFEYWGVEWFIAAFYLLVLVIIAELSCFYLVWFFNFEPFLRKVWGHIDTWKARFAAIKVKLSKGNPELVWTKNGYVAVFPKQEKK